jgi:hypothetical protein
MGDPTENTVNDLMASFLRNKGINITTQSSTRVPKGRRQPDFEVLNGGVVYGEGEWDSKYINGFNQAIEFGDIPGSIGYFLIGYPDDLKKRITQQRLVTTDPSVLLGDVTYRGVFKLKGVPSSLFRGGLEEIPGWLKAGIEKKRREEPSEFIRLMGDIVQGLTHYLPMRAEYPSLFEHIIATIPKEKGELEVAKKASAYLLLNQVVFYNILKKRGLDPIDFESLKVPAELYTVYFKKVVDEIDYNAIFDFDVASLFPKKSLQFIKDMVRIVAEIQPEEFTRDLLGNIFHSLIPLEVRKPVAAYYTNPMAARLLAKLAIHEKNSKIADFACGSGTLLMAAYERKEELLEGPFIPETHKQFIENDITGVDIMPFAAHLAVVQLALKNPFYLTDKVRIGVHDSTGLHPGDTIKVLQRVLPRGQQVLATFVEDYLEKSMVTEGALSGKGGGQEFTLSEVDVVIMNPPFTRQEKIPRDFKSDLQQRFNEYKEFIHPQMGLRAYFMLLADRFLKPRGRMAFVLPATTLRVESMEPLRRMMATRYVIEYIITTDYRSAFSESTALREILLIARKRVGEESGRACLVTNLKVLPNSANIPKLEKTLINARTVDTKSFESELCKIHKVEQQEFLENAKDWSVFLPSEQTFDSLIEIFSGLENVRPLREIINPRDIKRCDYPSIMHVVWERTAKTQEKGNILKKVKNGVLARSKLTGKEIVIPNSAMLNGLWALSGLETLDITNREDRIISKPFPGYEAYFDRDVSGVFKNWGIKKLSRYTSDFFIPRKVDISASGTVHLAVRTSNSSVPSTSIWGFGNLGETGKLLALFINSTIGIALLFRRRIEVRGAWSQFSKETLLSLPVLDVTSLNAKTKKELLRTYNKIRNHLFPSLLEQLNTSFDGRMAIDKAIFSALGLKKYEDEREIQEFQLALAKELEHLKEMMARD